MPGPGRRTGNTFAATADETGMIGFSTPLSFSTPFEGMQRAEASVNQTAQRIARIGGSAEGDFVDLSTEAVNLVQAKTEFEANLKAAKTEDQMSRSLLSLIG